MHDILLRLSRGMAWAGGAMLTFLVGMTCLSILGRAISDIAHADRLPPGLADWLVATGIGPIRGAFEMTEAGVAFAIFVFLPLCQITGGHATVDILADRFGPRANRILRGLTEALFAAILVLVAVQLASGMVSKYRSGQTTLLMQLPVWQAYALSLSGAVLAATVAVWMAALRLTEMLTGRAILPDDGTPG